MLGAVKSRGSDRLRHHEAREHSRKALELFIAADSTGGRARALNNLGYTNALLGEHQVALEYCQAALILHQELGDRHGQAATLDSIALAHHHFGRYREAIDGYREALTMFAALGNRYFMANTSRRLGDVHLDAGRPDEARRYWQEALAILDDLDHTDAAKVREKLRQLGTSAAVDDRQGIGSVRAALGAMTDRPPVPGHKSPLQSSVQSFDARKKILRRRRDS